MHTNRLGWLDSLFSWSDWQSPILRAFSTVCAPLICPNNEWGDGNARDTLAVVRMGEKRMGHMANCFHIPDKLEHGVALKHFSHFAQANVMANGMEGLCLEPFPWE